MPLISPSLPDGVPGSNAGTAGKAAGPNVEPDVRERFNVESDVSCLRTDLLFRRVLPPTSWNEVAGTALLASIPAGKDAIRLITCILGVWGKNCPPNAWENELPASANEGHENHGSGPR